MEIHEYLAHLSEDHREQSVIDHLTGTAALAQSFARAFQAEEFGRFCGMLHDAGKYSAEFQRRIRENGPKVDHSTAGAQTVMKVSSFGVGLITAYCVAGHHTGLPDGGSRVDTKDEPTLSGRLKRNLLNFQPFFEEVSVSDLLPKSAPPIRMLGTGGFTSAFFIRMLFSCLVDADYLDTEAFMGNGAAPRGLGEGIPALFAKLQTHLKKFDNPQTNLNQKRSDILRTCLQKAAGPRGLYTLTVPTGGGKTLASVAFALRHAEEHTMGRVIYAIPYTSIIEQNATVFREIFGERNVLEHHSNFTYDDHGEEMDPRRLAAENWDAPLIVTTNVQFFESLFSNKSSRCRKLHNIANSVIIFDEAQMIPRDYLIPCIRAISELVANYGCTVVLCSATQPALHGFFPKELKMEELCGGQRELYNFFRRTKITTAGQLPDDELAARLNAEAQVLCIVNTRKQAQVLFALLEEGAFHLSTLMYPKHRSAILNEIRLQLKNGLLCRVVSTSLIEAGVDLDFPVVYRAQAGLDSEIQAAGRCNREGKSGICPVYIFEPEQKYQTHMLATQARPAEIARSVERQFEDCSSPEAISAYFTQLYAVEDRGMDSKDIVRRFEEGYEKRLSFPFATVADDFRLIEKTTRSILIPDTPEARELTEKLRAGMRNRQLLRLAQQYSVNVYENHYQALYGAGCIQPLDNELAVLEDLEKYHQTTGLEAIADTGVGVFV